MEQAKTPDEILAELRKVVAANGSQKETARVMCISPSYLCDLLAERREISAEVAAILGFRRIVTFEPLRNVPAVVTQGADHHELTTRVKGSISILPSSPQQPEDPR